MYLPGIMTGPSLHLCDFNVHIIYNMIITHTYEDKKYESVSHRRQHLRIYWRFFWYVFTSLWPYDETNHTKRDMTRIIPFNSVGPSHTTHGHPRETTQQDREGTVLAIPATSTTDCRRLVSWTQIQACLEHHHKIDKKTRNMPVWCVWAWTSTMIFSMVTCLALFCFASTHRELFSDDEPRNKDDSTRTK